jgi:hypothetical protein
MTDRDVLPDNVKPKHYDLSLRDLEFTNWTYKGTVTYVTPLPLIMKLALTALQYRLGNHKAYQGNHRQHSRTQALSCQGLRRLQDIRIYKVQL